MDKRALNAFNKYVKKFDLKDKAILMKFHHTYRVVEYAKEIAKSLDLSDDDIEIIELCALLHDIARFKQWEEYNTYKDKHSFDHGDMGCELLLNNNFIQEFVDNNDIQDFILKSTKNHNKYSIDEKLTEKEKMITNIIRDADKIDILIEQYNSINDGSDKLKDGLVNNIKNKTLCEDYLIDNHMDGIMRAIGFVFDMNYRYSYKILLDKKVIEDKFNLLKIYTNDDRIEDLEKETINYMKEMAKC